MLPQIFLGQLRGKRFSSFFQRLGFWLPTKSAEHVIWCHAVSVGEVKALSSFFLILKKQYPQSLLIITTVTKTGHDEALKSLKGADLYLYLPLDFSFAVRRFVSHFKPDLFFLVEGDVWPNCLKALKKYGAKIFLISAKMSLRSFGRWSKIPFLASYVFSHFDLICVQSEEFFDRFVSFLGNKRKVCVTGNLKLDYLPKKGVDFPCRQGDVYITVSCTHFNEEYEILKSIIHLPCKIFLAPRHPERFAEVGAVLKQMEISFVRISQDPKNFNDVKVILIDCMGVLNTCYKNSLVAIVGGSFIDGIGGHNVLEPLYYGCPSIFGPYTYTQNQLVKLVLTAGLGCQSCFINLAEDVHFWMENRPFLTQKIDGFTTSLQGCSEKTFQKIFQYLEKNST